MPLDAIPILGRPFTIETFAVTVLVRCTCPAKTPLLLIAGHPQTCPACQRTFQFTGVSGPVNLNIAVVPTKVST